MDYNMTTFEESDQYQLLYEEEQDKKAWELTGKLVSIDSSDPGACEGAIEQYIHSWLQEKIRDLAGDIAEKIELVRREVLPGRFNLMCRIPGRSPARPWSISAIWIRLCWGRDGIRTLRPLGQW